MTATVFDLASERGARLNGERSLRRLWMRKDGPVELGDFGAGDRMRFRDGKVGTILRFCAGSIRGPLTALVAVDGPRRNSSHKTLGDGR